MSIRREHHFKRGLFAILDSIQGAVDVVELLFGPYFDLQISVRQNVGLQHPLLGAVRLRDLSLQGSAYAAFEVDLYFHGV